MYEKKNKKVLIISFFFPPNPGIGGVRIYGLAKNLLKLGWTPVILTTELMGKSNLPIEIIECVYKDKVHVIKKIFGINRKVSFIDNTQLSKNFNRKRKLKILFYTLKNILLFPDRYSTWYKHAISQIDIYFKKNPIEVIISSSGPITSHRIASHIKKKYNVKWIADYRDLWSTSHYLEIFESFRFFLKKYEKFVLRRSDILTSVSKHFSINLMELHNKKVETVTNGYDEDVINSNSTINLSDKFEIVYTGQLYQGKRDPSLLFECIKELITNNLINERDIKVSFYGPYSNWLEEVIHHYHLENIVKQYGKISREKAIEKQFNSQILLLLCWENSKDIGNYPGKVFEYLAARRPIISIGLDKGVIADLLKCTKTGYAINEKEKLKGIIQNYYNQYKTLGYVGYNAEEDKLEKFTQLQMAYKFIKIIEGEKTPRGNSE